MSQTTICTNPMCACDPCGHGDDCRCGIATLGDLERRVMAVLWKDPGRELTGRDVANVLTEYAYTTVATVLDRLSHKGLVSRRMEGRTIRFTAIGTQGAHAAVLMHDSLKEADDPEAVLFHFAETLSRSEAETLRLALDRLDHQAPRARR